MGTLILQYAEYIIDTNSRGRIAVLLMVFRNALKNQAIMGRGETP